MKKENKNLISLTENGLQGFIDPDLFPIPKIPDEILRDDARQGRFRMLQDGWRSSHSRIINTVDSVAFLGKAEARAMALLKIRELTPLYRIWQKEVMADKADALMPDDYYESGCLFYKRQLERFSQIYLTATDRKPREDTGFTDEQIQQAREYPIEELYEGHLRTIRNRFMGRCPFHEEHTASFVIYENGKGYHCFGCGAHGQNAIDYLMRKEKLDFQKAVRRLI